ncbi:MAG: hypothetical protein HZA48_01120 [Planctomycetes bacterium]|nr:hypothetical protein [Planctomycetota bacterium]
MKIGLLLNKNNTLSLFASTALLIMLGCGGNDSGIGTLSGAKNITTNGTSGGVTDGTAGGGTTDGTAGGDTAGGTTGGDTGGTTGGDTTGGDTGAADNFPATTVQFTVYALMSSDTIQPASNVPVYVDGTLAGLTNSSGILSASVPANPNALVSIDSILYTSSEMNADLSTVSELSLFTQAIDANQATLTATTTSLKSYKGGNTSISDMANTAKITVSDWELANTITVKVTSYLSSNVPSKLKDSSLGITGYPIMGGDVSCRIAADVSKTDTASAGFSGKAYPEIRAAFQEFNLENIYQLYLENALTISVWYYGYDETQSTPENFRKWTNAGKGAMQYISSSSTYLLKADTGVYIPGLFPFVFVLDSQKAPEITVSGTVQDVNGAVPECFVFAENSKTITDALGNFSFTMLTPAETNKLLITANKPGYDNESIYITLTQDTASYTGIIISMQEAGTSTPSTGTFTVTGTITNFYDGLPIENAEISLWTDVAVVGDTSGTISSKTNGILNKLTVTEETPRTISVDFLDGVTYTWEFKNEDETSWHTMQTGAGTGYTSMTETAITDAVNAEIASGYQYFSGNYDLRVQALHSNGLLEEATGTFTTFVNDAIIASPAWEAADADITAKGGWSKGFYSAAPALYDAGTSYSVEWYIKASATDTGTALLDKKIASSDFFYASQFGYFLSDNFASIADNIETGVTLTVYAKISYTLNSAVANKTLDIESTVIQQQTTGVTILLDELDITAFYAGPFAADEKVYTGADGVYTAVINDYYDGYVKMQVSAEFFYDSDEITLPLSTAGTATEDVILYSFPFVTGTPEVIAGSAGQSGSKDGTGSSALFNSPQGITGDGTYLYVCDTGNYTIRRIKISTGAVTTIAGSVGMSGTSDSTGLSAKFLNPQGISYASGFCFISDIGNGVRRLNISTLETTTVVADESVQKGIITNGTDYYVAFHQMVGKGSIYSDQLSAANYVYSATDTVSSLAYMDGFIYAVINSQLFVIDSTLERGYLGVQGITNLVPDGNSHLISYANMNFKRIHLPSLTSYDFQVSSDITDMYFYNDSIYAALADNTIVRIPLSKNIESATELTAAPAKASLAPFIIGTFDTGGEAYGIYVDNSEAYISDYGNGLIVADVLDLTLPGDTLLEEYNGDNFFGFAFDARNIGSNVFVASEIGDLEVINRLALSPPYTQRFTTPGVDYRIDIKDPYIFLTNWDLGLQIIDSSDPSTIIGACDTPNWAYGLTVSGNYAYVADGYSGGLVIIDVSNPFIPVITGSLTTPGESAVSVFVQGNYAYLTNLLSGMQIIDITNKSAPVLAGTFDSAGFAYDVFVSGNYAYIADGSYSGLVVVNITDPSAPELLGSCLTDGFAHDVFVVNNHAFVADGTAGMQTIGGILEVSWP